MGSVKNNFQSSKYVVKKYGLNESKTSNGSRDKIVNTIIIARVAIIGPMAFSTSEEKVNARVQTILKLRYANP